LTIAQVECIILIGIQELKDYRNQATKAIDLPENAFKAAVSILQKFGKKMGLAAGSH